jgi:hypothetical protein
MANLVHISGKLNKKAKAIIDQLLTDNRGQFAGPSDKGALFAFETSDGRDNFVSHAQNIKNIYLDKQ